MHGITAGKNAKGEAEEQTVSLCVVTVGQRRFGLATRDIREVLGSRSMQAVPLAPPFLAGVLAYRGEVLTVVNLRRVLGIALPVEDCALLVVQGNGARFGLQVDSINGVLTVRTDARYPNPVTLNENSRLLFRGAFDTEAGLIAQLDPGCLKPEGLEA